MDGATNFMSDTLNDVLSMDKIEEGAMSLNMTAFYMEDVFNVSVSAIKGSADAKQIIIGNSHNISCASSIAAPCTYITSHHRFHWIHYCPYIALACRYTKHYYSLSSCPHSYFSHHYLSLPSLLLSLLHSFLLLCLCFHVLGICYGDETQVATIQAPRQLRHNSLQFLGKGKSEGRYTIQRSTV